MVATIQTDRVQKVNGDPVELPGQDAAKSWHRSNMATPGVNESLNVSGYTDEGIGRATIAFTTSMANANYAGAIAQGRNYDGGSIRMVVQFADNYAALTASAYQLFAEGASTGNDHDANIVCTIINGDLA